MEGKPNHAGVIIDGTRRYSKKHSVPLRETYVIGARRVYDTVGWMFNDFGVNELTVYAFSYDNLKRTSEERDTVFAVQESEFAKWVDDPLFDNVRVRFVGEYTDIPYPLFMTCNKLEEKTKKNEDKRLNILMGYIGYREVANAVRKILKEEDGSTLSGVLKLASSDATTILSDKIRENMMIKTPVNLIIRTGAENRISGFLPWQSEYAELFFLDKLWPEIEKEDMEKVFKEYEKREKRKGK